MSIEQAEKCPKFESCEAPLCPLDIDTKWVWYEDEDVCKAEEHKDLAWIQMQKKLKLKRKRDTDTAYTYDDLMKLCEPMALKTTGRLDNKKPNVSNTHKNVKKVVTKKNIGKGKVKK